MCTTITRRTYYDFIVEYNNPCDCGNKVFIWYHLGYFLGRFKMRLFAGFESPVFRFYLFTNLGCTRQGY